MAAQYLLDPVGVGWGASLKGRDGVSHMRAQLPRSPPAQARHRLSGPGSPPVRPRRTPPGKDRAVFALPSWKAVPGTRCPRLPPLRAVTRGHSGALRPHGVLTAMAPEVGTVGPDLEWQARSRLALDLLPLTHRKGFSPFPFCCSNVPGLPTLNKHSPQAQASAGTQGLWT